MAFVLKTLAVAAIVAGALKLYILYYERRLIFFPIREVNQTPADVGISFEWRRFLSYDGNQLTGWWVRHPEPIATILFFHGNAGNIGDRLQNLALLRQRGFSVFIFDYRGYGESEGKPSEEGLKMDADAAYEELTVQLGVPPEEIVFFGRSLGAVLAAHTARGRPIRGIILEGCFPSAREMAEIIFAPIRVPHPFISVDLNTIAYLKLRRCPLLVIHGTLDDVIPYRLGQDLFSRAEHPKSFYAVEGGSHNDCYLVGGAAYFDRIAQFAAAPAAAIP
ncbi:alpha/beta hydrolase [bacterium]|nr:alpha/beta hydrolase [bacterium]